MGQCHNNVTENESSFRNWHKRLNVTVNFRLTTSLCKIIFDCANTHFEHDAYWITETLELFNGYRYRYSIIVKYNEYVFVTKTFLGVKGIRSYE